jgi:hypothetical protein
MRKISLALILVFAAGASVRGQGKPTLKMLGWLTGCWSNGAGIDENWMKPAGDTMFGSNRVVKNGKTQGFEFMRLREGDDGVFFTAWLAGQDETSFRLISWAGGRFVFENPQHDFPQRVIYQRRANGSMLGRIEGVIDGKPQAADFPFQRAKCVN